MSQNFSDAFADRQLLTGTSATITGSNTNYTLEPFEPRHAGKIDGHSAWISWVAPDTGLVTLSTAGSDFDTLLAVYTLENGNDPPMQRLEEVSANDDYGGVVTSYLQFGANSNQTYQIAVAGFNDLSGNINLQLNFLASSNFQPTVLFRSGDQALRIGDPLILTMSMVRSHNMDLTWYLNGNPLNVDDGSPSLVIPSLQRTNLGIYTVKVSLNDDSFFSTPVEIQVNSEGQQQALGRYKLADAGQSGLTTSFGVLVGFNGTQIFNTTQAIVDTNAPDICGVRGGAQYWFSYQAPTNGLMTIDTGGSSFNTLLGVYTYIGTLTSFTNLINVGCDTNSGSNGLASQVQFLTAPGQIYFVIVDGVNGARGIAHLNYSLNTSLPPAPPLITSQPQPLLVSAQTPVALSVVASGTGPMGYQWWRNTSMRRNQTNASLLLGSPQSQDSGTYTVVVTNIAGAVTSSPVTVQVISAPVVSANNPSNYMISCFPAIRGFQYSVDSTANGPQGAWTHWTNVFPDYGGIIWLTNGIQTAANSMFLRVHSP